MQDIIYRLLMGFEAVICFLLIGIILIQRSKGQGAGISFGGGADAIFGAQMGNVLTRTTVVLGILFLANTTLLTILPKHAKGGTSLADRAAAASASAAASAAASTAQPGLPVAADGAALLDDVEAGLGGVDAATELETPGLLDMATGETEEIVINVDPAAAVEDSTGSADTSNAAANLEGEN